MTPVESREHPSDLRKPLGMVAGIRVPPENTPSRDVARWTGSASCWLSFMPDDSKAGEGSEESVHPGGLKNTAEVWFVASESPPVAPLLRKDASFLGGTTGVGDGSTSVTAPDPAELMGPGMLQLEGSGEASEDGKALSEASEPSWGSPFTAREGGRALLEGS